VGQVEGLWSSEGVHFLGWDRLWGMRGCEVGTVARVGAIGLVLNLCVVGP
jgi:hypothetical protein